MRNNIENMLLQKGVKVTAKELDALTGQWSSIQQLKKELKHAELKDFDIGVTHNLKEGVYE